MIGLWFEGWRACKCIKNPSNIGAMRDRDDSNEVSLVAVGQPHCVLPYHVPLFQGCPDPLEAGKQGAREQWCREAVPYGAGVVAAVEQGWGGVRCPAVPAVQGGGAWGDPCPHRTMGTHPRHIFFLFFKPHFDPICSNYVSPSLAILLETLTPLPTAAII